MTVTEAIQDVINVYNRVVDDREFERLREIFDAETRYWLPTGLHIGVDFAIAGLEEIFADGRSTRHWTANTSITQLDDVTAQAVSDLFLMEARDGAWIVTIVGRYHDRFRCIDGRWIFAEREITYVPIPPAS